MKSSLSSTTNTTSISSSSSSVSNNESFLSSKSKNKIKKNQIMTRKKNNHYKHNISGSSDNEEYNNSFNENILTNSSDTVSTTESVDNKQYLNTLKQITHYVHNLEKQIEFQAKQLNLLQNEVVKLKEISLDAYQRNRFFWAFVANKNGIKLYDDIPSTKLNNNDDKKTEFISTCIYPYKHVLKLMEPFISQNNEQGIMCLWVRAQFIKLEEPVFKEVWCPLKINNILQLEMFHLRDNFQLPVEFLLSNSIDNDQQFSTTTIKKTE